MILKKSLITLFVLLSFSVVAQENAYKNHIKKAMEQYRLKNYDTSTKAFASAFAVRQDNKIDLYNAACSASLANRYKLAFEWLNMAIDLGYNDARHLQEDTDFLPLRSKEDWQNIITKIEKKETVYYKKHLFNGTKIDWLINADIDNIYTQCSDSLKSKVSKKELRKTIRNIQKFFKQNHITNTDELEEITHGTSTSHIIQNGRKTEASERKLIPNTFHGLPVEVMQNNGYILTIEYLIIDNSYQLNKLEFIKPYFTQKYLTNSSLLKESIAKAYTVNLYTYYNKNKYNLKKDLWNNSFSKPVIAITKLPFVKNKKVQFTNSDKPYYLILLADKRQHKTVTIIFSDNNKYILISDGHKMGFVRDKKAKVRKMLKALY